MIRLELLVFLRSLSLDTCVGFLVFLIFRHYFSHSLVLVLVWDISPYFCILPIDSHGVVANQYPSSTSGARDQGKKIVF